MDGKKRIVRKRTCGQRVSNPITEEINPLLISKALWCLLDMYLNKFQEIVKDRGGLQSKRSQSPT